VFCCHGGLSLGCFLHAWVAGAKKFHGSKIVGENVKGKIKLFEKSIARGATNITANVCGVKWGGPVKCCLF
jgi:hypothetical protein